MNKSRRKEKLIRILSIALVINIAIIVAIGIGVFLRSHKSDDRETFGNNGLHGAIVPKNQKLPNLSKVKGIEPAFPSSKKLKGKVVLIVATCLMCRSGDILGGSLQSLGSKKLPNNTQVLIIGWNGDAKKWRKEWNIPSSYSIHTSSSDSSRSAVKDKLHVGDSGFGFLYDKQGYWRTSYSVQALYPDDVRHDMKMLLK